MGHITRRQALVLGAAAAVARPASAQAAPIRIAGLFNLTGYLRPVDEPAARGAEVAVAAVNAAGGVLGRPLDLAIVDTGSTPDAIAAAARAAAADPAVAAAIGFCDNDAALVAAPALIEGGLLLVTPGATSPRLIDISQGHVVPACFTDSAQAAAAAEYARTGLGLRSVFVVVDEGEDYTRALAGYFAQAFERAGGVIAGRTGKAEPAAVAAAVAAAAGEQPVHALFVSAMSVEIGPLVKALRAAGLRQPVIGGDSYDYAGLEAEVGPAAAPLLFTTHAWLSPEAGPAMAAFLAAYRRRWGSHPDSGFAPLGYDAVGLLAMALAAAGGGGRAAVRAALSRASGYAGASGVIAFPAGGGNPSKTVFVMELAGGGRRLVQAVTPGWVPGPY